MDISKLSELVITRYAQQAAEVENSDGREAAQKFLADRFDEEIKGLTDTATELRAGLIWLMSMPNGAMLMRVKIPASKQQ